MTRTLQRAYIIPVIDNVVHAEDRDGVACALGPYPVCPLHFNEVLLRLAELALLETRGELYCCDERERVAQESFALVHPQEETSTLFFGFLPRLETTYRPIHTFSAQDPVLAAGHYQLRATQTRPTRFTCVEQKQSGFSFARAQELLAQFNQPMYARELRADTKASSYRLG